MKAPGYVVIRLKDMELVCFTTDIGAAINFVKDQSDENTEYVIYERLSKKTLEPKE